LNSYRTGFAKLGIDAATNIMVHARKAAQVVTIFSADAMRSLDEKAKSLPIAMFTI
jgi:hypothetical protein